MRAFLGNVSHWFDSAIGENDIMNFFDYFQVMALVFFYLIFVGRILQLRQQGTNPFVIGLTGKGVRGLLEISLPFALVVWTIEVITRSLHLRFHVFPNGAYVDLFGITLLKLLGAVFIITGLIIFVLSLVSFGRSWRIGIDKKNPGKLVTTGIFSMTRNPIFLFLDFYLVGTWLIYPNLFFGIFAVFGITGIHSQILQEEEFLSKQYGEEYREYAKRVRRYF